jgi:hypothetical protein
MKHVDVMEIVTAIPVTAIPVMSRREKLRHWATAVRAAKHIDEFGLYHGLEYQPRYWLEKRSATPAIKPPSASHVPTRPSIRWVCRVRPA